MIQITINHFKKKKKKQLRNHLTSKKCSLYPDVTLSSTFSSFLLICLLQSYPIPLLFLPHPPTLFSVAFKAGFFLMMPGYQIWITVRTQESLFPLRLMPGSQNCDNQDRAPESYPRPAVNSNIQVVQCRWFLEGGGLSLFIFFLKFEKHWHHNGSMHTKKKKSNTNKTQTCLLIKFCYLAPTTQLCSTGTSPRAWLHSTFHIWSRSWKHLKSPDGISIINLFVEQLFKVYLMTRQQHILHS